jgi:hypothetical protein
MSLGCRRGLARERVRPNFRPPAVKVLVSARDHKVSSAPAAPRFRLQDLYRYYRTCLIRLRLARTRLRKLGNTARGGRLHRSAKGAVLVAMRSSGWSAPFSDLYSVFLTPWPRRDSQACGCTLVMPCTQQQKFGRLSFAINKVANKYRITLLYPVVPVILTRFPPVVRSGQRVPIVNDHLSTYTKTSLIRSII